MAAGWVLYTTLTIVIPTRSDIPVSYQNEAASYLFLARCRHKFDCIDNDWLSPIIPRL